MDIIKLLNKISKKSFKKIELLDNWKSESKFLSQIFYLDIIRQFINPKFEVLEIKIAFNSNIWTVNTLCCRLQMKD